MPELVQEQAAGTGMGGEVAAVQASVKGNLEGSIEIDSMVQFYP